MAPTKSVKKVGPKKKSQPELTEVEQRELMERENQIRERRAETRLELIKLFLENEKLDIARRRLKEIVADYGGTAAAIEAKTLIKKL